MKSYISLALGCSLILSLPSLATAATKADIEGKKACWGGNDWKLFHPGGKVTSSVVGEGTWSVSKSGVITVKFPSGPYSGVIAIRSGGMVEYSGTWIGTPNITAIGAFCD
jgi:hypothetical protein